ncbi:MAG: S9 family peptidase [Verrucomicrobia bacterium]|nr:S9 family peptidase [Verrucomicrobiota bacterium]
MKFIAQCCAVLWGFALLASAQVPANLLVEGITEFSADLKKAVGRYLEFRSAGFNDWHPSRREVLITTRFADSTQLHLVRMPGGARKQLTFFTEPVAGGSFRPERGDCLVFSQDTGGGEFYQLYRYDLADGNVTLLTDGKSRNTGARWSRSGHRLAYTSTRRNGKDNDIYVMDPGDPKSDRLLLEVSGGGWAITDWSRDDRKLLLLEYISINESYLHLCDAGTGAKELLTPKGAEKVAYLQAQFAKDGQAIYVTTDKDAEFQRLARIELATRQLTPLTAHIPWDAEDFDLSPDGRTIAFVTNEDGVSVLHLLDARTGKEVRAPKLPVGVISGLKWHENGRELGFSLSSARSPADVYSVNVKTGRLERWTESETGGLDPTTFVEPELIRLKSFDGLAVSGFLYRPDARRFPGPRPVVINIHGGPESQSRPIFQARNNYLLNELGVAILYPNVRGSAGRGKTSLSLDNGFKREDSVKDIGAFIDWLRADPRFDRQRIAVYGGSYGGYMVLASLTHFSDKLRAGIDVVGISSFLTFLKNTQDYRRDLRRVEYGDERDPAMATHLEKISPLTNVKKITRPLLVVQGKNDPRVPLTEAEQMVKAIRDNGGTVWYLMAKDEGHGFAKKKNADFMFLAAIQFLREQLMP